MFMYNSSRKNKYADDCELVEQLLIHGGVQEYMDIYSAKYMNAYDETDIDL